MRLLKWASSLAWIRRRPSEALLKRVGGRRFKSCLVRHFSLHLYYKKIYLKWLNFLFDTKLKSTSKITIIGLFLLLIVISSPPCIFQTGFASYIEIDEWVDYTVLESSNGTNFFYGAWPPGYYFGNWNISKGEHIHYAVTSSDIIGINGTLTIGNYTFNDVRNIDVASALALSIYPWNGGFFANSSDWSAIKTQVEKTNTSIEESSNLEHKINDLNQYFDIIKFNTTNYYGQNSLFYYDKESGILLCAKSCFGNYSLNISLSLSSLELGSPSKTYDLKYTYAFSYILVFLTIIILKRKPWKKST